MLVQILLLLIQGASRGIEFRLELTLAGTLALFDCAVDLVLGLLALGLKFTSNLPLRVLLTLVVGNLHSPALGLQLIREESGVHLRVEAGAVLA